MIHLGVSTYNGVFISSLDTEGNEHAKQNVAMCKLIEFIICHIQSLCIFLAVFKTFLLYCMHYATLLNLPD